MISLTEKETADESSVETNPPVTFDFPLSTGGSEQNSTSFGQFLYANWAQLFEYSLSCAKDHIEKCLRSDKIALQHNESGFVRLHVARSKNVCWGKRDFRISIRLNYWPQSSVEIPRFNAETIHNHPFPFISTLISGTYTHVKFDMLSPTDTRNEEDMELYKFTVKRDTDKNTIEVVKGEIAKGEVENPITFLRPKPAEQVGQDDTNHVDTDLIHQVMKFDAGTLSLNMVYSDANSEKIYNIFTVGKISKRREAVAAGEGKDYLLKMLKIIENYIRPPAGPDDLFSPASEGSPNLFDISNIAAEDGAATGMGQRNLEDNFP